ncbi:MAG: outer membrane lipoprotein carrier protein LolA, partial [Prevotella sp.]
DNVRAQRVNQAAVKRQIAQAATKVRTLQCDFVQTKYVKMLNDKMVASGKMYYQKSDCLRWQYTAPYSYTFIINGTRVNIHRGQRSDVINVNQSKMFKEIARIMMNSVVGKNLNDSKDFRTTITADGANYLATLYPLRKQMKGMFSSIVLHINGRQSMVTQVDLHEKNGDRTVIQLRNTTVNRPINAQIFNIR